MPTQPSPGPGYSSSEKHLADELHRAAGLVRAALVRFKHEYPEAERERFWHLRDAVLDELAADEPRSPLAEYAPAGDVADILAWVDARRGDIDRRIGMTPRDTTLLVENLRGEHGLAPRELDLLLLALLPQLHSRYRWLYGVLQRDAARTAPSAGFLAELCARDAGEYAGALHLLANGGTLVSHRLLTLGGTDGDSLALRPVSVEDRVAGWLLGDDAPDPRLAGLGSWAPRVASLRTLPIAPEILNRLEMLPHLRAAEPEYVAHLRLQFGGPDATLAARAFGWVAGALGFGTYVVDVGALLRAGTPFDVLVELALREARLGAGAILFSEAEALVAEEHRPQLRHLLRRLEAFPRPAAIDVGGAASADGTLGGAYIPLMLAPPTVAMRRRLWRALLGNDASRVGDPDEVAGELAAAFQLTDAQIREAYAAAHALARRRNVFVAAIERSDLFAASRSLASRQLVAFAERVEPDPELTLDKLVLPPLNRRPLLELRDRIRTYAEMPHLMGLRHPTRQGRGVLALFVGGSGTGKTMAAEALASGQHVDFFRVDLAALVSKWVGETEKNLARIFADAERTNGMLFFDEADAMFGRRGEVREARDRWANLEVNYLLQAVERHPGVVILATNFRHNIDEAFLRRIHVIVDFPTPDAGSRRRIWAGLLPAQGHHVVTEAEVNELADRFDLTGGNIRNVVVDACFRAMQAPGRLLTARHLVAGVVREYQKLVRPITLGEFGQQFYEWATWDVLDPHPDAVEAGVA